MKKIAGFVSLLVLVVIGVLFVYNIGDKSKSSLIVKDDVTVMYQFR